MIDGQDGGYFTVNATPGSTTELVAVLGNAGDQPVELRTFASNAVTLVNGGFGVEDEDSEPEGPTTWLNYSTETYEFGPNEGIERSFTVTVPEDTAPGEYITGISLQTAEPVEIPGSTMFNQIIRKSIAVFIIVEGETTAGFDLGTPEILTTTEGGQLNIPVTNTGDVLVRPSGTVTLTNAEGEEVFSAELTMGSVYANMDTLLSIPLEPTLAGEEYDIDVSLSDEASGTTADLEEPGIAYSGEIPESAPVQLQAGTVNAMPDEAEPVYAEVDLNLLVESEPITNANVVLHVYRDGELVEDFSLSSNTTIATGESNINQRYIPADGFDSGEWSFAISIERMDRQTGSVTTLVTYPLEDSITIP